MKIPSPLQYILYILIVKLIYSSKTFQVQVSNKSTLTALEQNKTLIEVLTKYFNYANIFSFDPVIELHKNKNINKYAIKLIKREKSSYRSIYSFNPMKLEILKVYIKLHLKTRFIQPFKSPISILIYLNKKLENSLYLYINQCAFNNLIIKIGTYYLSLIRPQIIQFRLYNLSNQILLVLIIR